MKFALVGIIPYKQLLRYLMLLIGLAQHGGAESFMDSWLARQQAKTQDDWLVRQVVSQVASSNSFDQDGWLSRQKTGNAGEFLAGGVGSQVVASSSPKMGDAWTPAASWEADAELEESLLSDIEEALGKQRRIAMESRIAIIELGMRSTFQALPKNEYGKLGHASVRYMLHRFFVDQHGWFIDGLFAEGAPLNASSPSYSLKNRVPMFVQGLFEKRLGGRGFGCHELAVMVAVVEDSVHREAQMQFNSTFHVLGMSANSTLDNDAVEITLEAYMSGFIMNTHMLSLSAARLLKQREHMLMYYPLWPKAQAFFREVRNKHMTGHGKANFAMASAMVWEIVDTFGSFVGQQCQGLKQSLIGLEKKSSTGCVSLPDFYRKGLKADISWLFVESSDYLRHIGVLDETNPRDPRLLSANYINSPTNCLQPSGYYLVCCHNECDDIMGRLEKELAAPSASPVEILTALAKSSPFSVPWPREGRAPGALRFRLEQVAEYNNGLVPIHGRLFAQWLHHVYPHECPYPHLSGTKHAQYVTDFEKETGKYPVASEEEMAAIVGNASKTPSPPTAKGSSRLDANFGSCAPWQDDEELFAPLEHMPPLHELENDPHVWNISGGIVCLTAASTFLIAALRTLRSIATVKSQAKMMMV